MNRERTYTSLPVYSNTIELVQAVNKITELIPRSELAGLTHKLKLSAIELPVSIALGFGEDASPDDRQTHIHEALNKLAGIEVLLQVALDLKFVHAKKLEKVLQASASLSLQIRQLQAEIEKKSRRQN